MTPRSLASLLICSTLLVGCRTSPTEPLNLVGSYSTARSHSLLALDGRLGSDEAAPFLEHWRAQNRKTKTLTTEPAQSLGLKILAFEPCRAQVKVEARLANPKDVPATCGVKLDGAALASIEPGPKWQTFTLHLPPEKMQKGEHILSFTCPGKAEWRTFSARSPQAAPVDHQDQDHPSIDLPFGTSLEYPICPGADRTVSMELSAWQQPGAPEVALGDWKLRALLRGQDGRPLQSFEFSKFGRQQFHFAGSEQFRSLFLELEGPTPLPGQLGVTLFQETRPTISQPSTKSTPPSSPPLSKHPNVVLFVVDTMRADYLDCYGYDKYSSPRLSEFAEDAVRYENCYAPAPWTKPTVATLLTGLPPNEHGVLDFADKLPEQLTTLAEALGAAGYKSLASWNNGLLREGFGLTQGYTHQKLMGPKTNGANMVYWVIKSAPRYNLLKDPFFLHIHLLDPHEPYRPSARSRAESFEAYGLHLSPTHWGAMGLSDDSLQRLLSVIPADGKPRVPDDKMVILKSHYSAEIRDADHAFGQLIDWLKDNNLYDDSLIVVTADHGEELLDHGYLGHVTSLHRELLHVPLLVKYPRNRQSGKVVEVPCELAQVPSTILQEARGTSSFKARPLPLPDQPLEPPRPLFSSADVGRQATAMLQGPDNYRVKAQAVHWGDYSYAETTSSVRPSEPAFLYNEKTDPLEQSNLLWKQPALALYLRDCSCRSAPFSKSLPLSPKKSAKSWKALCARCNT